MNRAASLRKRGNDLVADKRRHVKRRAEGPRSGDTRWPLWLLAASIAIGAFVVAAPQLGFASPAGDSVLVTIAGAATVLATAVAVVQYERARRTERESAVQQERRRLARELHDGVAQELAFIVGQSRQLALAFPDERALADIGSAAANALDDSRLTIDALRRAASYTLGGAVEHRARVLADRAGLELQVQLAGDLSPTAELEHCLLAILQEAISNAARHAHATRLELSFSARGETIELRVSDDGCGFDQGRVQPSKDGGFGLLSMSERARELGGALTVESARGQGTMIDVTLPAPTRGRPRVRARIAA